MENSILIEALQKININASQEIINSFDLYYNAVIEGNKIHNLTKIEDWSEFVYKHFLDSLLPYELIPDNSTVIDIGTGAGFPAIPLKIVNNSLKLTLVDSLQKRINFLSGLKNTLKLDDVTLIHSRCEDLTNDMKNSFDVAVARAVAPLNTLCEYTLPFVKKGGMFIAYKALDANEEIKVAEHAIKTLGGMIVDIKNYVINDEMTRNIVIVNKVFDTDIKYPRGKNLPRIKPLT